MSYFDGIVGQEGVKRKLSFYLDAHKTTRRFPFILLDAARGLGKTLIARTIAENIMQNGTNVPRHFIELNCSSIRNNQNFFDTIFMSSINGKEVTILFDEAHALPKDFTQALLTICNTEKSPYKEFRFGESTMEFDFTKVSFIFATTETDKIFPPLKDRLESVSFEAYSLDEMAQIVKMNCDEVVFKDDVMNRIVSSLRGNARSCVKVAQAIGTYCEANEQAFFDTNDWSKLCYSIDVIPHGLSNIELQILKCLKERGPLSLNMLASITGMSRGSIQKDVEQFLIRKDFLRIQNTRRITEKGMKALRDIDLWKATSQTA